MRQCTSVIIVGGNHHNTLGMVRCYGMAGIKVVLVIIGSLHSFISSSRYVKEAHYFSDENAFLQFLRSSLYEDMPLVISCSDAVESCLDINYDLLKDNFCFFNAGSAYSVTRIMDKKYQVELAGTLGIKVPVSFVYEGTMKSMPYPCILKPLESINGGKHLEICYKKEDLNDCIERFANKKILIQQYINKESEIVVLGLAVNGEILIPGYVYKRREYDGGTLYSTVYSINELSPIIVNQCQDFIKATNYEGLFGIEFIVSGGNYYFIEANLRNDATTYSLACSGANLPYIYYLAKMGIDYSKEKSYRVNTINSIVEYSDFKHRRENGLGIIAWLKEYIGSECKYYWNWYDPIPFVFAPFMKK